MLKRATYEAEARPGDLFLCPVTPCKENAFSTGPPQTLESYEGQGGRVFKMEGVYRCHARHKFRIWWTEIPVSQ